MLSYINAILYYKLFCQVFQILTRKGGKKDAAEAVYANLHDCPDCRLGAGSGGLAVRQRACVRPLFSLHVVRKFWAVLFYLRCEPCGCQPFSGRLFGRCCLQPGRHFRTGSRFRVSPSFRFDRDGL